MSNYPIIEHMEASLEGCKQMIHDYEQLLNYVKTIEYANAYLEKKNAKLEAKLAKCKNKIAKLSKKTKNNIVMEMEPLSTEDLEVPPEPIDEPGYITDDDQTWGEHCRRLRAENKGLNDLQIDAIATYETHGFPPVNFNYKSYGKTYNKPSFAETEGTIATEDAGVFDSDSWEELNQKVFDNDNIKMNELDKQLFAKQAEDKEEEHAECEQVVEEEVVEEEVVEEEVVEEEVIEEEVVEEEVIEEEVVEEEVIEEEVIEEEVVEEEVVEEEVVEVEEVVEEEVVEEEVVEADGEEEDVYEIEINGNTYYVCNEVNSTIYAADDEGEITIEAGKYVNGKPVFN